MSWLRGADRHCFRSTDRPEVIRSAAASFPDEVLTALEPLDQEFFSYPHNLTDLLFAYVSRHPQNSENCLRRTTSDAEQDLRKLEESAGPNRGLVLALLRQPARENYFSLAITLPDCNSCSRTDLFAP
jgi:hypothetical protein